MHYQEIKYLLAKFCTFFCNSLHKPIAKYMRGRSLHPHDLRVSFATYLYQTGNRKLLEIQRLLGHGSSRTTEGYIISQETKLQQIIDALSA